ncbi:hypothetical protein E5720_16045 [Rhodococcus sp. PAMC28707]|uniref:hypothetical protein n=1 Tax=unclassified Rhodococcus (in: high G+C Gram-positive bacteria) TaxID=192944 RepID=UPI00109E0BA8|nr:MULTISPECIES: hypothetical protein [unclassified Rhodococcus (in: high G+C Gram-positive bacteria)]QCB52049.1 hypothetical protein E5769_19475 [Rhodococcus sp. PAMC28705]QCB59783.1 hypothetical protein E5720_16045 [Rhodococcus sp. PAMC28707]
MNKRTGITGVTSKIGKGIAISFAALAVMFVVTPSAGAQPSVGSTNFSSPVVGLNIKSDGYAGSENLFVYSTLVARTDPSQPGKTLFLRNGTHCGCTVNWRNLDTGATGSWSMPVGVAEWDPWKPTGVGRIEATARIDGNLSLTIITGRGSWIVP